LGHCKRGRANCNPHKFQPSMGRVRTTRALSIRFVPRNLTFLRAGAGGISSDARDRRRKGLRIASNAPPALSLSKVQNSTNSLPCPSTPRTNTGMARESRTQRSAAGWSAAVDPCSRRIRDHSRTEDGPPGRVTTDDIMPEHRPHAEPKRREWRRPAVRSLSCGENNDSNGFQHRKQEFSYGTHGVDHGFVGMKTNFTVRKGLRVKVVDDQPGLFHE